MVAGKVRSMKDHLMINSQISLLKFAAVYGANAAGKSNLVRAMAFAQDTIANGIPEQSGNDYCRISEGNLGEPSTFEYEIKIGDKYYSYGFDIILSQGRITNEWLYEIGVGEDKTEELIFSRSWEKSNEVNKGDESLFPMSGFQYSIEFGKRFGDRTREALGIYADALKSNERTLFISQMTQDKWGIAMKYRDTMVFFDVNAWFKENLRIVYPDTSLIGESVIRPSLQDPLSMHELDIDEIKEIIVTLGLGINDIQLVPMTEDEIQSMFNPSELRAYQTLLSKRSRADVDMISKMQMIMSKTSDELDYVTINLNNLKKEITKAAEEKNILDKKMISDIEALDKQMKSTLNNKERDVLSQKQHKDAAELNLILIKLEHNIRYKKTKLRDLEKNEKMLICTLNELNNENHNLIQEQYNFQKPISKKETPKRGYLIRNKRGIMFYALDKKTEEPTVWKLKFEHGDNAMFFDIREESDGTRRMIDLIEILCAAQAKSKRTYVIDEVDRSLHPHLTHKLVETFLRLARGGETQLIVTTHASHLMDLELLRRDEIWFVDKNKSGASSLYSLEEYNERFDRKVDKAYLEGRYGAVPMFDVYFPIQKETKVVCEEMKGEEN